MRLLLLLLTACSVRAAEPEVGLVGFAHLNVAAWLDQNPWQTHRTMAAENAPHLREFFRRRCGITPGHLARVSLMQFQIAAGDEEVIPGVVSFWSSREAIAIEPLTKLLNAKTLPVRAALPEGVRILEMKAYQPHGITSRWAVGPRWVLTLPPIENENRDGIETALIRKAIETDRELPRRGEPHEIARLSVNIAEFIRGQQHSEFGLGSLEPLWVAAPLLKARVLEVTIQVKDRVTLRAEFRCSNPADAKAVASLAELMVKQGRRQITEQIHADTPDWQKMLMEWIASLLGQVRVKTDAAKVLLEGQHDITPQMNHALLQSITPLDRWAAKDLTRSQLLRIGSAMVESAMGNGGSEPLIENITSSTGKPLLSWRVRMLPQLGYKELYDQFKLDEPWDSEHNRKLIEKMPVEFSDHSERKTGAVQTYFQAFVGKEGAVNRPLLADGDPAGATFQTISDGTSSTIAITEARSAVIWTKPDDISFDPEAAPPQLGGQFDSGYFILLCDGRVRFLTHELDAEALKAAITINGGEPNDGFWNDDE